MLDAETIMVATEDVLRRYGPAKATVVDVARSLGVSHAAVYRHFPSKADLFAEVFRRASQREVDATREAAAAAGGPASRRLAAAVETFARRALRGRRLAWALIAEPVDPAVEVERLAFRRAYAAGFEHVLREGVAAGELAAQNVELSAAALVGALGEALVGPLSPVGGSSLDDDALVADLVSFCLRSVTEEAH